MAKIKPLGGTIDFRKVEQYLGRIPITELAETEKFLNDDHWQQGEGWIGWMPTPDSPTFEADRLKLEEGFTSKNVCRGIVSRLEGAVFGKEPNWEIVPLVKDGEEVKDNPNYQYFKDVDRDIMKWWQDKKLHHYLKQFIFNRAAYGKAALRIYIPKGLLNNGRVEGRTFAEVLSRISIDVPRYDKAIDAKDTDFGNEFTVVELPKVQEEIENIVTERKRVEVSYVDENQKTHIRVMTDNEQDGPDIVLDLGGNLTTFIDGDYNKALISPSMKSMQKQVNHAKSGEGWALMGINFPETVFLNATMEKEKKVVDGKITTTLKDIFRGVGRWLNLKGIKTQRSDGSEEYNPADVKWRTPADPDKFARVATNNEKDMHGQAGMLYVFLADSEYASGNSKVEAMTDYLILLIDSKTVSDALLVWLLETIIRLVHRFTNKQDLNNAFRVIASTKLTMGKVSNEDKAIMLQELEKGVRDKRSYIVTAEVSDDAELTLGLVEAEQSDDFTKKVDMMKAEAEVAMANPPLNAGSATA
jgi:hypothetical protein